MTKRVAIVTGAAKPESIGYAVAQGLIRESCEVVVADLFAEGWRTIASGRLKKVFTLAGEDRGPEGPISRIPREGWEPSPRRWRSSSRCAPAMRATSAG